MKIALTAAGALTLLSPIPAPAQDLSCPGLEAGGANPVDTDRFYVGRAISIVNAALASDLVVLDALVVPEPELVVWQGDSGLTPRKVGRSGLIELFHRLNLVSYQSSSVSMGPIKVDQSDCTWQVTVLFRTNEPAEGVSLEFNFHDGLLVSAVGNSVVLMAGSLGKSAAAD